MIDLMLFKFPLKFFSIDFETSCVSRIKNSVNFDNISDQSFALCANQKGFIRCEKGSKITVISAVYGRTDNKVCPHGNINTRTCRSLTSEMKVKRSCNGYRTCHLHASNEISEIRATTFLNIWKSHTVVLKIPTVKVSFKSNGL